MKLPTQRLLAVSSLFASLESLLPKSSLFVSAMAPKDTTPLQLRVASYNVLSSQLSGADHYTTYNPRDLDPKNRLPVVLQKIDDEIEKSSIICLQEVSHDWAGRFHSHFANKGYHLVTGLYGKRFNGYMGVAIAFKTEDYHVLDVDISRLSDQREAGWPRKPRGADPNALAKLASGLYGWGTTTARSFLALWGLAGAANPRRPPQDAWSMAENRYNEIVTVRLRDRSTRKAFVVGNYHMPCAYYAPMVMTIHSDLATRHVQKLAAEVGNGNDNGDCDGDGDGDGDGELPCVVAGDWNIRPGTSSYRLLTTGTMDKGDPEWPTPKHGMEWSPTCRGMRSAYATKNGNEPDFTNYARVKEDDPFIDTLDYILLSDEWKVNSVHPIPHRDESGGPFPNLDRGEPSDHVLIAADLEL